MIEIYLGRQNLESHQKRNGWCSDSDLFDNYLKHEDFLISSLHLNGHINHLNNCNNIEDVIWELHDNISFSLCVYCTIRIFLLTNLIYYQKGKERKIKFHPSLNHNFSSVNFLLFMHSGMIWFSIYNLSFWLHTKKNSYFHLW